MIQRDYLLRMIQEFLAMLSRLSALKKEQKWLQASSLIEDELKRLAGSGSQALANLSETELMAHIIQGEPTQIVQQKAFMVATLLSEAGTTAAAEHRGDESRACFLKSLHLLLDVLSQEQTGQLPAFIPKIDELIQSLSDQPLPLSTQARLMQHFERIGEFARAEDALFAMLDAEPEQPGLVEFGVSFYERVARKSDDALAQGNLPRAEVEAGLLELRQLISS